MELDINVAVLLTTYNRKTKTLGCLESLFNQNLPAQIKLATFLTDDASPDNTADTVKIKYPSITILKGTGSLFWAGGMRLSWRNAMKTSPNYYLLLNDDTVLIEDAVDILVKCAVKSNSAVICVGSTKDPKSGMISYGGQKLYNKNKVQNYVVYSETETLECDMANANIMLVPQAIVAKIGILSDDYVHSIADFDYTLRARKAGFKVVVVPGILGLCTDDHGNKWTSVNTSLKDRIKYLMSPKGLEYKQYLHFIKLHFPLHLPAAFVKLWLKTLLPVLWNKFKN